MPYQGLLKVSRGEELGGFRVEGPALWFHVLGPWFGLADSGFWGFGGARRQDWELGLGQRPQKQHLNNKQAQ